uniref:PA domain-containing protein n=1 Tax=Aegilops tauschii TaxID=37682 RepID=M8B3T3_AEGTA
MEVEGKGIWGEPREEWGDRGKRSAPRAAHMVALGGVVAAEEQEATRDWEWAGLAGPVGSGQALCTWPATFEQLQTSLEFELTGISNGILNNASSRRNSTALRRHSRPGATDLPQAPLKVVYANYGRTEDYAYLASRGVNVTGKVALARYGKVYRGDIVKNARDAGAAAAVIFTDPKDYTPGKAFPDGPWMPPTGVQVGSTFKGVGDPTTPMWASSEGCERVSVAEAMATDDMPGIPALPVSGRDGEEILRLVGGDVAPEDWQGGEGAPVYHLGPGPAVLNLSYTGNETLATIQNVISVIEGKEEPDRYVILGNHRDAWTFGAADPNSGTAALLEIGSTEWVEENRAMLTSRTVAYLNVDVGVSGSGLDASATPQLDELLKQASKKK